MFSSVRKVDDATKELMSSSFNSQVAGTQRAIEMYWGFFVSLKYGSVFGNRDIGLKTVLDNNCKLLQAEMLHYRGHNVLSDIHLKIFLNQN